MKNRLICLYIVLISLGLGIIGYFLIMKKIYKEQVANNDPLNVKILDLPMLGKNCCSSWPISHFLAYFVFTLIWPEYWLHLFVIGVVWECIEWLIKYITTPSGKKLKFKRTRTENGNVEYEQWWSSSSKDVLFNSTGIICALILTKLFL